jgi:hypothetical protein
VQNVSQSADEEYMVESHNHLRAMSSFSHEIARFFTLLYRKSERPRSLKFLCFGAGEKETSIVNLVSAFFY